MREFRAPGGQCQGGTGPGRAIPVVTAILSLVAGLVILLSTDAWHWPGMDGSAERAARWREAARYHAEETGDVGRAIAVLESLTAALPDDAGALTALGELLSGAPREWDRAIGLFRRAIELDSLAPDAHAGLVEALIRTGATQDAVAARARFATLRPDHPYPYILAVRLAYLVGDRSAVDEALENLRSAFPDDRTVRAWVAEERARIALVDGRLEQADARYREALAIAAVRGDPAEVIERSVDRAWAMTWWSADTAAAVALVDSAIADHPMESMSMDEWPFHYLAEFFALAGRPARATAILESHAAHMNPPSDAVPNPWWQAAWGLIALDESRPEDAVRRFQLWDVGIGCTVCALGDLARAFEAAGQTDSAIAVWER
ncbi:MAG: tetratricopeptide repeat protein, partial [Gemmatimonadota bacterium]